MIVVYTTVAYATIKDERSFPIRSGLNSDFSAVSAIPAAPAPATDVLVMLTIKPGVEREKVMRVMPDEIRATVRLYLDGKIRQWYSRADGTGVVFVLDCRDVAEATSVMEALPLAKERLVNLEFTALTPLTPIRLLLDGQPGRP
jgi:hypothetical protein